MSNTGPESDARGGGGGGGGAVRGGAPPPDQGREVTFEAAERELEQIVERLERGDAPLDEAIRLWERGEELYRFCRERLDAAHGRIEELARRTASE
jgi:exodeoxyribonuclease VII small subunit